MKKFLVLAILAVMSLASLVPLAAVAAESASGKVAKITDEDIVAGKNPVQVAFPGGVISGDLYVPEGYSPTKLNTYPGIVVNPPAPGQTSTITYAKTMTSQGYLSFTIEKWWADESAANSQSHDEAYDRAVKINDAAIAFLRDFATSIDDEIFSTGICAGLVF